VFAFKVDGLLDAVLLLPMAEVNVDFRAAGTTV
jgi:hypothetical protein